MVSDAVVCTMNFRCKMSFFSIILLFLSHYDVLFTLLNLHCCLAQIVVIATTTQTNLQVHLALTALRCYCLSKIRTETN